MDIYEIKLAQLNRQSILSNVVEPSFFDNTLDDDDVEQVSLPLQNVRANNNNLARETTQHHKRLTRDQQPHNINTHKPPTDDQAASSSHKQDCCQFNSSLGSLELQKRVVKHCFPDEASTSLHDSSQMTTSSNNTKEFISLKDTSNNKEKESVPKSRQQLRHASSTRSSASTLVVANVFAFFCRSRPLQK